MKKLLSGGTQVSPLDHQDQRQHGGDHDLEHEAHCTSLCCAKRGDTMLVTSLCGCEDAAAKLRDLGVREGVRVTVVRDGDPLLVRVDGARFGIGRVAAMNVLCNFVSVESKA